MNDAKKQTEKRKEPDVAPGYNDRKFGVKATHEDIAKGESTKVTRVYLDENDPS